VFSNGYERPAASGQLRVQIRGARLAGLDSCFLLFRDEKGRSGERPMGAMETGRGQEKNLCPLLSGYQAETENTPNIFEVIKE
jgi:hypothetical protein